MSMFTEEFRRIEKVYNDPARLRRLDKYTANMISKPIVIFGASFVGDRFL